MRPLKLALGLATAFLMACDGTGAPSAPDQTLGLEPLFNSTGTPECVTISFDDQGFSHGDAVTSLTTGFGFNLTVAVVGDPNGINTARAFNTGTSTGPDPDLQASGRCPNCAGLGNGLVIEGAPDFASAGDSDDGGTVRLTGFAGNGTFSVESFKALDQEPPPEELAITLSVDGTQVGASRGEGDGSVETVATDPTTFEEVAEFGFDGSGAIDDIVICREQNPGRMTGGGTIRLNGTVGGEPVDVRFTHGFTLHCDVLLSNNLEINWGGNQWHIEKESLEHVRCIDDPVINPEPPPAPFDTFIAAATGRLNGEWGSHIYFTLIDAGEPGGKGDMAGLSIWDVGVDPHSGAAPIIVVALDFIVGGNLQAHYDQPHGNKPNK